MTAARSTTCSRRSATADGARSATQGGNADLEFKRSARVADSSDVAFRLITLQTDGTCVVCGARCSAGSMAWWDDGAMARTCLSCRPVELDEPRPPRHTRRPDVPKGPRIGGRSGPVLSDDPQSTIAWARGSDGERRLARRLTDELAGEAIVLHDRSVPRMRCTIDHLAIAPSGVWVIDGRTEAASVAARNIGGRLISDLRLYVGNRDRTTLVDGVERRVEGVRVALTLAGIEHVPIRSALCFTAADWGSRAVTFQVRDVLVAWPAEVISAIREGEGEGLDVTTVEWVARALSSRLPVAR